MNTLGLYFFFFFSILVIIFFLLLGLCPEWSREVFFKQRLRKVKRYLRTRREKKERKKNRKVSHEDTIEAIIDSLKDVSYRKIYNSF